MRTIPRLLASAAAVTLAAIGLAPTASAASRSVSFELTDGTSYEYVKTCSNVAPYTCGTYAKLLIIQIVGPWPPRNYPIHLDFQVDPITATPGADYTVTSGTATIPAGQYVSHIIIPLVADAVAEPTETVRVRLTRSSIGGNISDTAIGTIWNDGQIPRDCNLSKPDLVTTTMTCTDRPAGQRWRHVVTCGESGWGYHRAEGPAVTGSGSSTAVCNELRGYDESYFEILS